MSESDAPVVLIVEDDPDLAEMYGEWLSGDWIVEIAYDGETALDSIDGQTEIVLLDRRMPGLSGDDVLDAIRERGLACRVAMVTAVEPDFDIVEMGFDEYIVKPVSRDDLQETARQLHLRSSYDRQMRQYFSLAAKKAVLDEKKTEAERQESEEYQRLESEIRSIREKVNATLTKLSDYDAYHRVCQDIQRIDE